MVVWQCVLCGVVSALGGETYDEEDGVEYLVGFDREGWERVCAEGKGEETVIEGSEKSVALDGKVSGEEGRPGEDGRQCGGEGEVVREERKRERFVWVGYAFLLPWALMLPLMDVFSFCLEECCLWATMMMFDAISLT